MNLVKELDKIQEATISEFEKENYDMDAMQKLVFDYTGNAVATQVLLGKTPLAKFEKDICAIMDKSGYDYVLELVTIAVTCDGGCYEIYYHLSWYDGEIYTQTFRFETVY